MRASAEAPSRPGFAGVQIEATLAHPFVTVVSMVAPSPDWFVGVTGIPLFRGGEWAEELRVDAHAYDAGTDLGVTFLSPDVDQEPRARSRKSRDSRLREQHRSAPSDSSAFAPIDPVPMGRTRRRWSRRLPRGSRLRRSRRRDRDRSDTPVRRWCRPGRRRKDRPGGPRLSRLALVDRESECSDGVNNDPGQDSDVDFDGGFYATGVQLAPHDANCSARWQTRERRSSCGVAFEIAPALFAIGWARRRLRRRYSSGETMR